MAPELTSLLAEVEELRKEIASLRRALGSRGPGDVEARRSREVYETLITSIDGIVWEANPNTLAFTFVSPHAEKLLGYPLKQWTEEPGFWSAHVHPDDREWTARFCIDSTRNLRDHQFEYRMIAADGRVVWLDEHVRVSIEGGRAVGLHGIALDVTERKRAVEALRESEELYRQFAETVETVFWISEAPTGRIVYLNAAFERIWGIPAGTVLGAPEPWRQTIHPDDRDRVREYTTGMNLMPPGTQHSVDYRIVRPDGDVRWIHDVALTMPNARGRPTRIAGIAQDVTERRQADEELHASRERLRVLAEHLLSVREEERSVISREIHDQLGQGLTALKMDVAWIVRRLPPEAELLKSRAKAMSDLIDEIVQSVRRISTELRPSSLDDLGLLAAIEWQAQDFEARTSVRCVVNADWHENERGDLLSTALFRIVQEALTNVARHAQATSVKIDLYENDGLVVLTIEDDGQGMPLQRIADPKSIGLIGMRDRAELLGGRFSISSRPSQGTKVHVAIPVFEALPEEDA